MVEKMPVKSSNSFFVMIFQTLSLGHSDQRWLYFWMKLTQENFDVQEKKDRFGVLWVIDGWLPEC